MKRLFLLLAVTLGSAVLAASWPDDIDQRALDWERLWRRAFASFGWTLPGTPDLANLPARLDSAGLRLGAPILIRIFKQEFELELWLMRDGKFQRFATYPICRWSGELGPKFQQGDRQAPEGFYEVTAASLNPNSRWHRSFNLGFPNTFDRTHGRTGSFLMVHGGCSSVGCYAMTNAAVDEIWRIVTAALNAGQKSFQVQAFPFRMTARNLNSRSAHPHAEFWRQLERGNAAFEATLSPPRVGVCEGRYVFEPMAAGSGEGSEAVAAPGCESERREARGEAERSG